MIFTPLTLPGAMTIDLEKHADDRGFFARLFCTEEFAAAGLPTRWAQMNVSYNAARGTLRGMHFQRHPGADGKLVRCVRGAVIDQIVDLRKGSAHFGQVVSVELSADTHRMIFIPPGFAHGFQTLEPDTELMYLHTETYQPGLEGGIRFDDPSLSLHWPLPVAALSDRDASLPLLTEIEALE